jgi:hypothetical protein
MPIFRMFQIGAIVILLFALALVVLFRHLYIGLAFVGLAVVFLTAAERARNDPDA